MLIDQRKWNFSPEYREKLEEVMGSLKITQFSPGSLPENLLESENPEAFQGPESQENMEDSWESEAHADPRLFSLEQYLTDDYAVKHSDEDLREFADRMITAYELIHLYQPDAILYPLRGSEVFKLSFEKIAGVRGETESFPEAILLPLGLYGNSLFREKVIRGECKGSNKTSAERSLTTFSRYEKRAMVHTILERYVEQRSLEKILLIDEVIKGGAIVQNLKHVYPCLESLNADIEVFAMEFSASFRGIVKRDQFNRLVPQTIGKRYSRIRDQGFRDVRKPFNLISSVPPLVVDKQQRLPLVIRENDSSYELAFYTSAHRIPDVLYHVEELAKEGPKDLMNEPYLRMRDSVIGSERF